MATEADILSVRENVDEPTADTYTDEYVGGLIDAGGIDSASAIIWEKKAAKLASLVDTSEAGASRKLSDLHKNALAMAAMYRKKVFEPDPVVRDRGVVVRKIVRS